MWYVSSSLCFIAFLYSSMLRAELAPEVIGVEPMKQRPGQKVLIKGHRLSSVASIKLGPYEVNDFDFTSSGDIEAVVPLAGKEKINKPIVVNEISLESPLGLAQLRSVKFAILSPDPSPRIKQVIPPVIPRSGGTLLKIKGSGFQSRSKVTIAGLKCGNLSWINSRELQCYAPPHSAGEVDLTVTNPDSQIATLSPAFHYSWTRQLGAENVHSKGEFILGDSNGNLILVQAQNEVPSISVAASSAQLFLLKLNPAGETLWKTPLAPSHTQIEIRSTTLDPHGNIFVGGLQTQKSLTSHAIPFLAKYNPDGVVEWTTQLTSSQANTKADLHISLESLVVDKSGAVIALGSTGSDLETLQPLLGWKAFIIKFNSAGQKQWVIHEGSPDPNGYHLVLAKSGLIDGEGNLVLAGVSKTLLSNDTGTQTGPLFLAKYAIGESQSPRRLWLAKRTETQNAAPYEIAAIAMALTPENQITVLTRYEEVRLERNLATSGHPYFTLNKFTTEGDNLFSKMVEKNQKDFLNKVSLDSKGNVYLCGNLKASCANNQECRGSSLLFLKYDSQGNLLSLKNHTTPVQAKAYDFHFHQGRIYFTGEVTGSLDGAPQTGSSDLFVSRFDLQGNLY